MKNLLFALLLFASMGTNSISADAFEEIQNEDAFYLIQENVNNLQNADATNDSTRELLNLIDEGYIIDPFNMSKLIETLTHANATNNATKIIIHAIQHNSPLTPDHLSCLLNTLAHANASNNATAIILKSIELGIKFGPKERRLLAEISRIANAKKNVEKVRKALHERENSQP